MVLSATFLATPIISIITQIKNKYVIGMISFYPALFYYLYRNQSIGNHDYPNQIIRAICGMLLGVFVYLMPTYIKERKVNRAQRMIMSLWLVISFIVLIFMGVKSYVFISTYLLCFISIIMLTFCDQTLIPRCSSKVFDYLGQLSMPMFIWHYVIAHILVLFIPVDNISGRITVYYFWTALVSFLSMTLIESIRNKRNKTNVLLINKST